MTIPDQQATIGVKTRLLRQLKAVPLGAWPQALVDSLETLASLGVCSPVRLAELLQSLLAENGSGSRDERAPAGATTAVARRRPRPTGTVSPPIVDRKSTGRASQRAQASGDGALSPAVRQIRQLIHTHYREPISLRKLADDVGRNTQYISTLFHRQTGKTVHGYLRTVRMEHAAQLLRRSEKVEAVMLLVGYRSKKNFYRQFSNNFGMTPGCYKACHSSAADYRPQLRQT
jgi:AraC-like DNA-binding protein